MAKYVIALEDLGADVPRGTIGKLEWVSFNVCMVSFDTFTIETHVSLFASVRRGRRIIKAKRKLMQRPYRSAAAWRGDTFSEIEYMATLRQHIAFEATMTVSADVDLSAAREGHMVNRRISRNNARFMRKAAYREGFKLP